MSLDRSAHTPWPPIRGFARVRQLRRHRAIADAARTWPVQRAGRHAPRAAGRDGRRPGRGGGPDRTARRACWPSPPRAVRPRTRWPPCAPSCRRTPSPSSPAGRPCRTSGSRRARTPWAAGWPCCAGWPIRSTPPAGAAARGGGARPRRGPAAGGRAGRAGARARGKVGDEVPFTELVKQLSDAAYARVDMVTHRGEFAVRGGILDVFPPTEDHPIRVEFFGDEVDQMRCVRRGRPALADLGQAATVSTPPSCTPRRAGKS